MPNLGPASALQVNTGGAQCVALTEADFQSPSASVLANTSIIYQRVSNGSLWQSNGYSLIALSGAALASSAAKLGRSTSPTLAKYRNALAATAANTADTRVAFLGDSTTAGSYAAGVVWVGCRPLSAPTVFGSSLEAYLPVSQDSAFGDGGSTLLTFDPRMTASTANWSVFTPSWLGGGCYRNDTNEASVLRIAMSAPFDTIDVYYLANPGGASFTIGVDSGAAIGTTVSTNAALATVKVTRSCTLGMHVLNINRLVGAGACAIQGIVCSNSTSRKVQVYNWGVGGATVAAWIDNSAIYNRFPGILTLAPHLTFIELGINDAIAGTVPATFTASVQTLIDQCQVSGDVVGVIPSPVAVTVATLATQKGLYQPLRNLYRQNGVPIVDKWALYGDYAAGVSAGYFLPANNDTHPGAAGYAEGAKSNLAVPGVTGFTGY